MEILVLETSRPPPPPPPDLIEIVEDEEIVEKMKEKINRK